MKRAWIIGIALLLLSGMAMEGAADFLDLGTPTNVSQRALRFLSFTMSGGKGQFRPYVVQSTDSASPWRATDPQGNPINCTGTTTQCLQEFITASTQGGWYAEVHCQGVLFPSKTEPVYINTTSSINVPVAQDWGLSADPTCNLNINTTTTSGIIFDSEGATEFIWEGKITYHVTSPNGNTGSNPSCAVLVLPTNTTQDGIIGFYAGRLHIKSITMVPVSGQATAPICFQTNLGSIIQETIELQELNANAGSAFKCMMVFGAGASTGFMQNRVRLQQCHGASEKGIDMGHASTNQANYNSNIWVIENIEMQSGTARGVDTFGSYDLWQIGLINNAEGGLQYGVVVEASASSNQFTNGRISGATTAKILDAGTSTVIVGDGGVSCSGTPTSSFSSIGGIVTHC